MSFANQAYQDRCLMNGITRSYNLWAGGGGTGNCTSVVADGQIASINYTASTGKYTITFANVGAQATPVAINIAAFGATAKQRVELDAYSSTNKTLVIWTYTAGSLGDLATTDFLAIEVVWCDSTVPIG